MKLFRVTATLVLLLGVSLSWAATRRTNGSGGGNWTNPATFACNCIPASTDVVILEGSDTLTVDTSVTVSDFRYEYTDTPSALFINAGDTLTTTDDFIFDEPINSDATAEVVINGTLIIGSGTGNDLRIFLSNNEDNFTLNIDVQGKLDIAGNITHSTGALSSFNTINLNVDGTLEVSGTTNISFTSANCLFNFVNNGTVTMAGVNIESTGRDAVLSLVNGAGGSFTAGIFTQRARADDCRITVDNSGDISVSRSRFFAEASTDTVQVFCRNGSTYSNSSFVTMRAIVGTNNVFDFNVENGASYSGSDYLRIGTLESGEINVDIAGSLSLTNDFRFTASTNTTNTMDIASTGTTNCRGMNFTFLGDNIFDLTANGRMTSTNDVDFVAAQGDDLTIDLNETMSVTGRYYQSTTGANSSIQTNVTDSLIIGRLRYDVNTTAFGTDNEVNINSFGAVLSLTDINFNGTGSGTLTSGSANNSTVIFTGATAGDSIPVRASVEYDNLIVSKTASGGIALNGVLNNSNYHGNMNITSGARLNLNGAGKIDVQGDFTNNGTFDDAGNNMAVGGAFTNTSVFSNDGSLITIGSNFLNTGTFDNLSNAQKCAVTGNFTNLGTFDADFDSLVVGGNFSNTATYTSATNNIYLSGNWNNTGTYTFVDGDNVVFQGSSNQAITGTTTFDEVIINNTSGGVDINSGTTSIKTLLTLTSGALDTKGNMVFISDVNETAALAEITGGSITGNVTVQRFLDQGVGWYMLSSPVSGATIADWNNEMPMSGFTNSDEPANPFTSVYSYDQSTRGSSPANVADSGYVAATNTTNSIGTGQGWYIYFDQVKAGNTAKTIDITGPLNTGTVTLSGLAFSFFAPNAIDEGGWQLLGNPYASPVDWSLVTKSEITNDIAYVRGNSNNYLDVINDNVDYIYSGEGFWVQVDGTGSPPGTLTFNENDKAVQTDDFNAKLKPSPFYLPLRMELSIASDTSYMDYSVLRFGDDTALTANFDRVKGADSRKLSNSLGNRPNISSVSTSNNSDVYYNTMSAFDSSTVIPLRIWQRFPANKSEDYTVTFNGIEEWERNNKCLILNDLTTSSSMKVSSNNPDYTFTDVDTLTASRLQLQLTTPLTVSSQDASCYGFNDGSASVLGEGSGTHNYTWVDENGNLVLKENGLSGASVANNLAVGTYTIWVSDNGVCGTVGATVVIDQPEEIIADFTSSEDTIYLNENTPVIFTNSSFNASSYFWDFGDGSTSSAQNPSHTYTAGGEFNVKMIANQDGCSDTLSKTILVINNVGIDEVNALDDEIKIYQNSNRTFVQLNFSELKNARITMHDMLGREAFDPIELFNVSNKTVELPVDKNAEGIYTVSVYVKNEKMTKKLYFMNH